MSLYSAGITFSSEGTGAFVVVEKVPRKTDRTRDAWQDGVKFRDPVYEFVFRIVGATHLTGTLPSMAGEVAGRLLAEPLLDDTHSRVELGAFGRRLLALFHERKVYPSPAIIAGEKEAVDARGTAVIPISALQAAAALTLETDRLELASGLVEGPSLLHSLGKVGSLPATGPARDLGVAAAIALHLVAGYSGTAWPSNKPKPAAMLETEAHTAWERGSLAEAVGRTRRAQW